jgi:hypothetical protein
MRRTVCLLLIALTLAARDLVAQDTTRVDPGAKIPRVARTYGIIPGLGHVYAGEIGSGLILYITTTSSIVGAAMGGLDCFDESSGEDGCHGRAIVALAFGLGIWGWSVYDAGRAAERANAKRRLRVSVHLMPWPVSRSGAGASRPSTGLAISAAIRPS